MIEPLILVLAATGTRTLVHLVRATLPLVRDRVAHRRVVALTALAGRGGLVLDRHDDGVTLVLAGSEESR
jgi:hypothetical protein